MQPDPSVQSRGPLTYILVGSGIGLAIPFLFRTLSLALEGISSVPDVVWSSFDFAQLMFWPTPLLLTPTEEPGAADLAAWGRFTITTLANVALYGALAGLVWLGLRRSRWILAAPTILIAGIWYAVWIT